MPPPAQNSTCKTFCLFVSGFTRHIYEGLVSTHGSSLQFWHFPIYGEDAYVLEGRHGGLVGTRALGEENGPNKYVPSHKFQVCLSPPNVSSKN